MALDSEKCVCVECGRDLGPADACGQCPCFAEMYNLDMCFTETYAESLDVETSDGFSENDESQTLKFSDVSETPNSTLHEQDVHKPLACKPVLMHLTHDYLKSCSLDFLHILRDILTTNLSAVVVAINNRQGH